MTEHLPIQRWTKIFTRYPASEVLPSENGEYVTYADHLDALRACEERVLDAARDAVELKTWISVYELSDESKAYNKGIRATLAAIDALKEKQ